jgi:hypothetical protein
MITTRVGELHLVMHTGMPFMRVYPIDHLFGGGALV